MSWKRYTAAAVACANPARSLSALSQYVQEDDAVKKERFIQWLAANNADVTSFCISISRISPTVAPQEAQKGITPHLRGGCGAFYKPSSTLDWKSQIMGERVSGPIAAFPISLALTIETPFADPIIGYQLQELFEEKEVSPAVILALYILLQKKLGNRSQWRDWIEMLPESIHTPLSYTEDELQALNGTPLVRAARHMRHDMLECWRQLQSRLSGLCASLGLRGVPSQEDFLWAVAVVWSRAVEIPNGASNGTTPCLGIVPGLDFFNHASVPNCRSDPINTISPVTDFAEARWEHVSREGESFYEVHPMQSGIRLRKKTELTISYGERSNEELLFLYGFVLDMNPHDTLRIPLKDHDPRGREEILSHKRAPPFIVLPGGDALALIKKNLRTCWKEEELMGLIPAEVWETFEVLCDRYALVHEGLEKRREILTYLELVGKLKELLEMRKESLEGACGTGSLETDISFLQRFIYGRDCQSSWNAVVYRSTQKALNREWIKIAATLQERLKNMQCDHK